MHALSYVIVVVGGASRGDGEDDLKMGGAKCECLVGLDIVREKSLSAWISAATSTDAAEIEQIKIQDNVRESQSFLLKETYII